MPTEPNHAQPARCHCHESQIARCIDRVRPLVQRSLAEGQSVDRLVCIFCDEPDGLEVGVARWADLVRDDPELALVYFALPELAPGQVEFVGTLGEDFIYGSFSLAGTPVAEA